VWCVFGLALSFRRSQWRSAPLTHQKESKPTHHSASPPREAHQQTQLINPNQSKIHLSFIIDLLKRSLGRPPRKQFTNSISLPILKEQWKWICELIAGRVIIAVINQLSFIIQNKVFHYCRQQVYSCSNNCTVIILLFHSAISFHKWNELTKQKRKIYLFFLWRKEVEWSEMVDCPFIKEISFL